MEPNCLQCGEKMIKFRKIKTSKSYKAQKWKCSFCGNSELEFGTKGIDSQLIEQMQLRESDQEEPYEDGL